jgi:hypothetical protein
VRGRLEPWAADPSVGAGARQMLQAWSKVLERSEAALVGCRRLHRRYERKAEHFLAFTGIACTLICLRRLTRRCAAATA